MTQVEQTPADRATRLRRWLGPFVMLRHRNFRLLVAGQFSALVGDQLFVVALPFVLITGARDARDLGMVLVSLGVARAVGVPIGGLLSDRFQKRLVMLNSDIARALFSGLMAMVVISPYHPVLAMAAIAAGIGFAQGIFLPSSYSIVPQLVERDQIVAANSVVTAQMNASVLIGPALGGLLVAGFSPGPVLFIHSATFAFSAVCLALIRITTRPKPEPEPEPEPEPVSVPATAGGVDEGDAGQRSQVNDHDPPPATPVDVSYRAFLRYVVQSRLLPYSIAVTFIVNLGHIGMVHIALPAMSLERFDRPELLFGMLLTGTGVGALAGAVVAHNLLARPTGALLALSAGIVEGIAILLIPLGPGFVGSWIYLFIIGTMGAVTNVFFVSALQRAVPSEYLGRAMSVLLLAVATSVPISYWLIAWIVSQVGPSAAFIFAGLAITTAFIIGMFSREIRRLSLV